MGLLMARCAEGDQILGRVITEAAACLNMVDLKIFHPPARLAMPVISLQNFLAELSISFRFKPQAGSFRADSSQSATCTSSRSCFRCGLGRPITSRVRQGTRAF